MCTNQVTFPSTTFTREPLESDSCYRMLSEQKSGRVTASSVASSSEHFNHGVMERESLENGKLDWLDNLGRGCNPRQQ